MPKNLIVPGRPMIDACVQAAGISLPDGAIEKLETWLSQLLVWNQRVDLTAARSAAELADLMLADAFVLAARIPRDITVVDVGAGAGAPGLALAIARPDLRLTLVEPLAKRAAFLRTVLALLGREEVGVLRMKLEELETRFDVAISRATFPPAEWLARSAEVVVEGGSTWVLVAREEPPDDPNAERVEDVSYPWPNTGVKRRAVRYRV